MVELAQVFWVLTDFTIQPELGFKVDCLLPVRPRKSLPNSLPSVACVDFLIYQRLTHIGSDRSDNEAIAFGKARDTDIVARFRFPQKRPQKGSKHPPLRQNGWLLGIKLVEDTLREKAWCDKHAVQDCFPGPQMAGNENGFSYQSLGQQPRSMFKDFISALDHVN
jgi:hypothetical protein